MQQNMIALVAVGGYCFVRRHAARCGFISGFVRVSRKRPVQCQGRLGLMCLALQIFLINMPLTAVS